MERLVGALPNTLDLIAQLPLYEPVAGEERFVMEHTQYARPPQYVVWSWLVMLGLLLVIVVYDVYILLRWSTRIRNMSPQLSKLFFFFVLNLIVVMLVLGSRMMGTFNMTNFINTFFEKNIGYYSRHIDTVVFLILFVSSWVLTRLWLSKSHIQKK